jgi:hypothetical protein
MNCSQLTQTFPAPGVGQDQERMAARPPGLLRVPTARPTPVHILFRIAPNIDPFAATGCPWRGRFSDHVFKPGLVAKATTPFLVIERLKNKQ